MFVMSVLISARKNARIQRRERSYAGSLDFEHDYATSPAFLRGPLSLEYSGSSTLNARVFPTHLRENTCNCSR